MDSVFVVVDKFSKMSHFIPCKTTHDASNVTNLFFKEVERIHGLPRRVGANKDVSLWENFGRPY